ncbi:MAG: hypothetical protein ACKV2Q_21465 [Planctomycetaceae bacterium]
MVIEAVLSLKPDDRSLSNVAAAAKNIEAARLKPVREPNVAMAAKSIRAPLSDAEVDAFFANVAMTAKSIRAPQGGVVANDQKMSPEDWAETIVPDVARVANDQKMSPEDWIAEVRRKTGWNPSHRREFKKKKTTGVRGMSSEGKMKERPETVHQMGRVKKRKKRKIANPDAKRRPVAARPHLSNKRAATTNRPAKYPDSDCQMCGTYLATVCYSKNRTEGRVPRTNKICEGCFKILLPSEKSAFFRYRYASWGVTVVNSGQTRKP